MAGEGGEGEEGGREGYIIIIRGCPFTRHFARLYSPLLLLADHRRQEARGFSTLQIPRWGFDRETPFFASRAGFDGNHGERFRIVRRSDITYSTVLFVRISFPDTLPRNRASRADLCIFRWTKRGQKRMRSTRANCDRILRAWYISSLPWLSSRINMQWGKHVYTNKAITNIDKSRIFILTWSLLSLRFRSRGQSRARAHHYLTVINSLPSLPQRDNYISWEM